MSDNSPGNPHAGRLHLGAVVDPATHQRGDEAIVVEPADLTTHGVIVGMTGSGKTGLGVVLLEEALQAGIPTLVIDPKGDMGNLALRFPALGPADFEPWVDTVAAERDGVSIADRAAETATTWREGLAGWGIGPERVAAFAQQSEVRIYTPGSTAGIALNVIGSMRAPRGVGPELMADEIEGLASSLLGLVGIDADPLSSREHILISNLVHHAWSAGSDLDLTGLIGQIQQPPMRKLGVIDLDTFFPAPDRLGLALKLNGLMASPAFAAWVDGIELDIASMLWGPDGRPRCAVVTIAHLSDAERQFVVTLVLSKLVTWMRSQPGTTDLRALVYMDEVFGFVPPSAMPPAKKPILTILKQARAFGVGMVLSTQNPVDLDYKAISNAGTWMIGRLQTERDKARLLEGMTSASGAVDVAAVDATISGLGKREFVLHSSRGGAPLVFTSRWAMSYLPGPLSREQISGLMAPFRNEVPSTSAGAMPGAQTPGDPTGGGAVIAGTPAPSAALGDDETTTPPPVADGIRVAHLRADVPWCATVGGMPGGRRLEPALAARVHLVFDETAGDIRHEQEWEAVLFPLTGSRADMDAALVVDHDERDLTDAAPEGARYVVPEAKIAAKAYFNEAKTALVERLFRTEVLPLQKNAALKVVSRPGESDEDFRARCAQLADDALDAEADALRKKYETRIDRATQAVAKAEDRLREAEHDAAGRGQEEVFSGVGEVLGGLFGGRKSARSILSGIQRAGGKRRLREKAEERTKTAANRVADEVAELEALEDELAEALLDLEAEWTDVEAAIEPIEVRLEKNDITVDDLILVWIPVADR